MSNSSDLKPKFNLTGSEAINNQTATIENRSLILGSQIIHEIFISICPSIRQAKTENIEIISKLIKAYLFGKEEILNTIMEIFKDPAIIEIIQGIDIIKKENNFTDIQEIERALEISEEKFRPIIPCTNIIKSISI